MTPNRLSVLLVGVALAALGAALPAQKAVPLLAELGRHTIVRSVQRGNLCETGHSVEVFDASGDGEPDIVVGMSGFHYTAVFLGDGYGKYRDVSLANVPRPPVHGTVQGIASGDVDADGDSDLFVAFQGINQNPHTPPQLWINDGSGAFRDETATRLQTSWLLWGQGVYCCALFDADGDGDLDLFIGTITGLWGRPAQLFLNDGRGLFRDVTAVAFGKQPWQIRDVTPCDLDGDRDLDLAMGTSAGIVLFINDGTGVFKEETSPRLKYAPYPQTNLLTCGIGDVDGDGDLDVVGGQNPMIGNHPVMLWLNDGKGYFTDVSMARLPQKNVDSSRALLRDLDEDGDLDLWIATLLSPGLSSGEEVVYENDGRGYFTDASGVLAPLTPGLTYDLRLADLDGDGDLDAVVPETNYNICRNRLWLNRLRQIHAPLGPQRGRNWQLDIYGRQMEKAMILLGAAPARLDLVPFGRLRLDPNAMITWPQMPIINTPDSRVSISVPIPSDPAWIGIQIYAQALLIHPVDPLRSRLTNAIRDTVDVEVR